MIDRFIGDDWERDSELTDRERVLRELALTAWAVANGLEDPEPEPMPWDDSAEWEDAPEPADRLWWAEMTREAS